MHHLSQVNSRVEIVTLPSEVLLEHLAPYGLAIEGWPDRVVDHFFILVVIFEVTAVDVGYKRRLHLFRLYFEPVNIIEPRITDHLVYGLKSVLRILFQKLLQQIAHLLAQIVVI